MKLIAIFLLFAATVASAQTATNPASEEVLLAADRAFAQETAQRRLEGWMAYMAADAVLFSAKPVVGAEAIRAFYQPAFANPDFSLSWQPTRAEMFPSGDTGYTTGRYELHTKDKQGNKIVRRGSYLTVWRKQADGSWKVIADGGAADGK